MKMTGEQRIAAPRERVWAALNDPEVLRQCIPGCQSLEKEAEDRLRATVEIKIGPIGAKFNGAVTLSDLNPPESYTITGQGQGGTVGSAKGGAKVRLAAAGNETVLTYEVDAEVGGRLAQLGGPIIDATAKQLAGKFFRQFGEVVSGTAKAAAPAAAVPTSAAVASSGAASAPTIAASSYAAPAAVRGSSPWGWIAAIALALIAGFYLGVSQSGEFRLIIVAILVIVAATAGYETGKRRGGGA
jgi:carbon monoxide dehydrogenase subunit G